jgi:threonine/homoserine/homoserine lactone efflux protein
MNKYLQTAIAGFCVSLSGTLPLGTLNATALQISLQQGVLAALQFSLGVVAVEGLYLAITLYAVGWVQSRHKLLHYLQHLTLLVFFAIALAYAYKACQPISNDAVLPVAQHAWLQGFALSAVNPAQFPFWIGWNTVLVNKGLLQLTKASKRVYVAAAVAGTFLGLCLFIALGTWLPQQWLGNPRWLYGIMAAVFAVCGLLQAYRLYRKKPVTAA